MGLPVSGYRPEALFDENPHPVYETCPGCPGIPLGRLGFDRITNGLIAGEK
jgi:hypothetical protein